MDNIIKYFYNFKVINIKEYDGYILINDEYVFKEYVGDIKELKNIINILNSNHIKHNQIILTKDNKLTCMYNNKEYILLKLINNFEIDTNFIYIEVNEQKDNITSKWEKIIDFNDDNNYINNYYNGLTENAIALYNKSLYLEGNIRYVISHFRVLYPNYSINYLDPTKMTIDVIGRDLSEYIKYRFIYNELDINEIIDNINKYHMSSKEINIFISRLLFPSYYYDLIKQNKDISFLLDKIEEYENFLKELIEILSNNYNLIEIDWLKKRTIL